LTCSAAAAKWKSVRDALALCGCRIGVLRCCACGFRGGVGPLPRLRLALAQARRCRAYALSCRVPLHAVSCSRAPCFLLSCSPLFPQRGPWNLFLLYRCENECFYLRAPLHQDTYFRTRMVGPCFGHDVCARKAWCMYTEADGVCFDPNYSRPSYNTRQHRSNPRKVRKHLHALHCRVLL
jgi:hypothetical protein